MALPESRKLGNAEVTAKATLSRRWPELGSFDERMASLLVVFPLYGLMAKHSLREYHGFELGLCLLLFVMEKMLHYEHCTYENARDFVAGILPLLTGTRPSLQEAEQATEKLLDELTNQGRPFEVPYHDLAGGKERVVKFRLLEQRPLTARAGYNRPQPHRAGAGFAFQVAGNIP